MKSNLNATYDQYIVLKGSDVGKGLEPEFTALFTELGEVYASPTIDSVNVIADKVVAITGKVILMEKLRSLESPKEEPWVMEAAMHVAAKNIREALNLPGEVSEFDEKISETYSDTIISKVVSEIRGDESEQAKDLRADIALRIGFLTMEMGREPTAEEINEDEVILNLLSEKIPEDKATSGIRKQNLAGKIKKASQDMGRK